jgi:hypothetical protein
MQGPHLQAEAFPGPNHGFLLSVRCRGLLLRRRFSSFTMGRIWGPTRNYDGLLVPLKPAIFDPDRSVASRSVSLAKCAYPLVGCNRAPINLTHGFGILLLAPKRLSNEPVDRRLAGVKLASSSRCRTAAVDPIRAFGAVDRLAYQQLFAMDLLPHAW